MAKCGVTNIGGGGGIGSDELSVTKEYVLSGKTYVGADTDDEIGTGTMENNGATTNQTLNAGGAFTVKKGYHSQAFNVTANSLASQTSGTATAGQILSGKTAWVNGNKLTGVMTVGSILSFSAAAYDTNKILLQWQNPYAATGKTFSGVFINYSTSGYPGQTSGTRIYTGYGNNSTSGGISQVIVTLPSSGTTYYFSASAYASCSAGDLWGTVFNASAATTKGQQVFTSSGTFSVPTSVRTIDIFCVGGGASGEYRSSSGSKQGDGGGSGYTTTVKSYSVTPGSTFAVTIGAGAGASTAGTTTRNGSATSFGSVCTANGGTWGNNGVYQADGNGGSGGGVGMMSSGDTWDGFGGTLGGTNGSNGVNSSGSIAGAKGQGTTTRAFGESSNTLYASGGSGYGATDIGGGANSGNGGYGYRGYSAGYSGICIVRWGY